MNENIHCAECGCELPPGLPRGLCPRCALQAAAGLTEPANRALPTAQPGDHIGRYKLLQQIGEGGCGVVFMAEQEEPIRRKVALKVIKLGMDTRSVIARFEAERQALALMDHANIAKVFDAGATDTGRPYFVMELVRGIRITDYCDQHNLTTTARLDLFTQVCHAIQHAHQKGIIHRDIKPSNILVTLHDGVPVPKVIDFGIAKATSDQRLTDKTLFTAFEQFMGTPAYMSPEQAELSGLDIDTRSDIYSLGVLLYELLTSKTPFDGKELLASGLEAMVRTIREKEPAKPSTRLSTMADGDRSTIASRRQTEPGKLTTLLRGDLDWIVMKALEKDRARRYETANGLAMDIQRHLKNEPVLARPPSAAYRFHSAWRRNKLAFSAATSVAVALLVGISLSIWQAARATKAKNDADTARHSAVQSSQQADRDRQRATASEGLARRTAYNSDMNLAQQALAVNNLGRARFLLNRQRPQPGQQDLRGWEWRYLWSQTRSDEHQVFFVHTNRMFRIASSADGRLLGVTDYERELTVMDMDSRKVVLKRTGVIRLSFTHRAPLLAYGQDGSSSNAVVVLWDTTHQRELKHLPQLGLIRETAFSPDDSKLLTLCVRPSASTQVSGSEELQLMLSAWDISSGELLWQRPIASPETGDIGHPFAVSPDGTLIAVGMPGGGFQVLETHAGTARYSAKATPEKVSALAFSPDGKSILSGACCTDPAIHIWNASNGKHLGSLEGHRSWITDLVFSPDGSRLASASADQTIRLWDWSTRKPAGILRGHLNEVDGMVFLPDGQSIASHCKDGTLYLWAASNPSRHLGYQTLPDRMRLTERRANCGADTSADSDVVFTPDSQSIVGIARGGTLGMWDTRTLKVARHPWGESANCAGFAISSDASRVVGRDADGRLHVWDVMGSFEITNFMAAPGTHGIRFTENGRYLIGFRQTPTTDVAEIWESSTWQRARSILTKPDGMRTAVTVSLTNSLV